MKEMNYIIIPGYGNSGHNHWQSHWEQRLNASRIKLQDWSDTICSKWMSALDESYKTTKGWKVLIAHSLGCIAVANWALGHDTKEILGAFLVSPPDLQAFVQPELVTLAESFLPPNLCVLPFQTTVVASINDQYTKIENMRRLASCWGSDFVSIGEAGHINAESGHGTWNEGFDLLKEFCLRCSKIFLQTALFSCS